MPGLGVSSRAYSQRQLSCLVSTSALAPDLNVSFRA